MRKGQIAVSTQTTKGSPDSRELAVPGCLVVHDKGPKALFFTLTSTMQRSAAPADGFLLFVLLLDSLGAVPLSGGSQESTSEARIAFGSSTALLVVEVKPQNDY